MIRNTQSIRFSFPVSVLSALLAVGAAQAAQNGAGYLNLLEVFTTTESSVTGESAFNRQPGYRGSELHVYELDGIQRIEVKLSKGLTADPEQSKRVVLQHFEQLREEDSARMRHTAMGLAKAAQYGVDRYPSIVFGGEVVVYGLTDLSAAADHYQTWQAKNRQ
ncbi:MAG: TIGR03757 family integrating conjugative element protein [Sedimenticola sp.]